MIVLAGLVLGALYGAMVAKKRGGRGLDQLQYGAVFAIAFGVLGMFLTIFIERLY
jgi:hypothetical protein